MDPFMNATSSWIITNSNSLKPTNNIVDGRDYYLEFPVEENMAFFIGLPVHDE